MKQKKLVLKGYISSFIPSRSATIHKKFIGQVARVIITGSFFSDSVRKGIPP